MGSCVAGACISPLSAIPTANRLLYHTAARAQETLDKLTALHDLGFPCPGASQQQAQQVASLFTGMCENTERGSGVPDNSDTEYADLIQDNSGGYVEQPASLWGSAWPQAAAATGAATGAAMGTATSEFTRQAYLFDGSRGYGGAASEPAAASARLNLAYSGPPSPLSLDGRQPSDARVFQMSHFARAEQGVEEALLQAGFSAAHAAPGGDTEMTGMAGVAGEEGSSEGGAGLEWQRVVAMLMSDTRHTASIVDSVMCDDQSMPDEGQQQHQQQQQQDEMIQLSQQLLAQHERTRQEEARNQLEHHQQQFQDDQQLLRMLGLGIEVEEAVHRLQHDPNLNLPVPSSLDLVPRLPISESRGESSSVIASSNTGLLDDDQMAGLLSIYNQVMRQQLQVPAQQLEAPRQQPQVTPSATPASFNPQYTPTPVAAPAAAHTSAWPGTAGNPQVRSKRPFTPQPSPLQPSPVLQPRSASLGRSEQAKISLTGVAPHESGSGQPAVEGWRSRSLRRNNPIVSSPPIQITLPGVQSSSLGDRLTSPGDRLTSPGDRVGSPNVRMEESPSADLRSSDLQSPPSLLLGDMGAGGSRSAAKRKRGPWETQAPASSGSSGVEKAVATRDEERSATAGSAASSAPFEGPEWLHHLQSGRMQTLPIMLRMETTKDRISLLRQLVAPSLTKGDTATVLGEVEKFVRAVYGKLDEITNGQQTRTTSPAKRNVGASGAFASGLAGVDIGRGAGRQEGVGLAAKGMVLVTRRQAEAMVKRATTGRHV